MFFETISFCLVENHLFGYLLCVVSKYYKCRRKEKVSSLFAALFQSNITVKHENCILGLCHPFGKMIMSSSCLRWGSKPEYSVKPPIWIRSIR